MTLEMTGAKIPFSETLRGRPRNIPFVFHLLRRHTSHYLLELKWSVRGDEAEVCTTLNRRVSDQPRVFQDPAQILTKQADWLSSPAQIHLRRPGECESRSVAISGSVPCAGD